MPRIARLSFLLPLVTALGLGRGQRSMETFPYGIRDERIRARIAGAMLAGDSAAAGLAGNPWPSLAQFQRLSWRVRRRLHRVRAPCLLAHASEDDIASVANAHRVMAGVRAPCELLLLQRSYHMVTFDAERDLVAQRSAAFFRRVLAPAAAPAGMLREPNLKMRPCPGVWRVRLAGLRTFHTAAGERARRSTNRRVEP